MPNNVGTVTIAKSSIDFCNIETSIFDSNGVGILTDWDQFKKYNWESLKQKNIPVFSYMFR